MYTTLRNPLFPELSSDLFPLNEGKKRNDDSRAGSDTESARHAVEKLITLERGERGKHSKSTLRAVDSEPEQVYVLVVPS
jgi:hypothetical protein